MLKAIVMAALPLYLVASPCLAQFGGDLQAQILYAYQTQDLNQLRDLKQTLAIQVKDDSSDLSLHYQLAHADYRFARIAAEKSPRAAEDALGDCLSAIKPVRDDPANAAEALVLESACMNDLANYRKVQGVLLRSQAAERLASAYKLAPLNPRVLLLRASRDLAAAKAGSPEYAKSLAELQRAAETFERSSATSVDSPGWGHADAYLALGREYARRGDVLAARNWIEKALLAAPDYRDAQRELAALVQR
jgi:tetratricopeptide (TPR) repeat protein